MRGRERKHLMDAVWNVSKCQRSRTRAFPVSGAGIYEPTSLVRIEDYRKQRFACLPSHLGKEFRVPGTLHIDVATKVGQYATYGRRERERSVLMATTCGVTYSTSPLSLKMYLSPSTIGIRCTYPNLHMSRDSPCTACVMPVSSVRQASCNEWWRRGHRKWADGSVTTCVPRTTIYSIAQNALANRLNLRLAVESTFPSPSAAPADAYFVCDNVFCVQFLYIYRDREEHDIDLSSAQR